MIPTRKDALKDFGFISSQNNNDLHICMFHEDTVVMKQ